MIFRLELPYSKCSGFWSRGKRFVSARTTTFSTLPSTLPSQDYLLGLRGVLTIQCFLFVFLQLFVPGAVPDSKNSEISNPHLYQTILRKSLGVLFFNEPLIYSFFIFLSARTICLPFLLSSSTATNPDDVKTTCASSIVRRGIKLYIPTCVALALSVGIFSSTSIQSDLKTFLDTTGNVSTSVPTPPHSFHQWFNQLFDVFWVTRAYAKQAANLTFPSGTCYAISIIFQQSYTVYMTMIILPYTRPAWRVKALLAFILTAWWVQSWAWYSVSGLLLADVVLNMGFEEKASAGFLLNVPSFVCSIPFPFLSKHEPEEPRNRKIRLPVWPLYSFLFSAGIVLQFLFIAWRPDFRNQEIKGHTGLYNSGSLNQGVDLGEPMARDDVFLVVLGVMGFVESFEGVKKGLRWWVLTALGRRSLSIFLTQPLLVYSAGIKLYLHLSNSLNWSHKACTLLCFIVCVPLVALMSEVFYRIVECPGRWAARGCWEWLRG